ncbi:MAG: hypothetical protein ACLGGX_01650 [Bdellovibrionia bacterium]
MVQNQNKYTRSSTSLFRNKIGTPQELSTATTTINPPQKRSSRKIKTLNNHGSVQFLFLMTLPLLISLIVVFAFFKYSIRGRTISSNFCRHEILNTQVRAGVQINKLLDLNGRAIKLIAQLSKAQRRLAACSGEPVCSAAATAEITKIEADRTLLSLRQTAIIAHGNLELERGFQKIASTLKSQSSSFNIWGSSISNVEKYGSYQLAVEPEFSDRAPPYRVAMSFTDQQTIGVTWTHNQYLSKIQALEIVAQRGCLASLEQTPQGFVAVLRGVKSSLNSYLY